MHCVLQMMNLSFQNDVCQVLLDEIDSDGDGLVDFTEFWNSAWYRANVRHAISTTKVIIIILCLLCIYMPAIDRSLSALYIHAGH